MAATGIVQHIGSFEESEWSKIERATMPLAWLSPKPESTGSSFRDLQGFRPREDFYMVHIWMGWLGHAFVLEQAGEDSFFLHQAAQDQVEFFKLFLAEKTCLGISCLDFLYKADPSEHFTLQDWESRHPNGFKVTLPDLIKLEDLLKRCGRTRLTDATTIEETVNAVEHALGMRPPHWVLRLSE